MPPLSRPTTIRTSPHFQFRATKTQVRRIDQFLVDRVPWLSRNGVQRLIEGELVTVNGKPTKASYKIKANDLVVMVAPAGAGQRSGSGAYPSGHHL